MKIISSSFVPYYLRSDLTVTEIEAIGSYQDLYPNNVQKTDWEFTIPSHWRNKSWCYAINSYCRFPEFSKILNEKERQSIELKIRSIDSAIQKSRIENDYFIFKGFYETEKFNTKIFGSNYADKAFGSFSLRMDQALKYTNPVKPILFQLFLETGSNALFMDFTECEILMPRFSSYNIKNISVQTVKTLSLNTDVTICSIEEVK